MNIDFSAHWETDKPYIYIHLQTNLMYTKSKRSNVLRHIFYFLAKHIVLFHSTVSRQDISHSLYLKPQTLARYPLSSYDHGHINATALVLP